MNVACSCEASCEACKRPMELQWVCERCGNRTDAGHISDRLQALFGLLKDITFEHCEDCAGHCTACQASKLVNELYYLLLLSSAAVVLLERFKGSHGTIVLAPQDATAAEELVTRGLAQFGYAGGDEVRQYLAITNRGRDLLPGHDV